MNEQKKWIGIHNGNKSRVRDMAKSPGPSQRAKVVKALELRKKIDASHGLAKGKHIHTIPGSMKKGGGL